MKPYCLVDQIHKSASDATEYFVYHPTQVLDVCRSIMSSGFYRTQCIVCGRQDKYRRKLRFLRFPKQTERCRDWLRVIGIKDLIYMSLSELFEQIVCEIHFHKRCFSAIGKRLLKMALPTMFTSQSPLPANIMAEWPPKYDQVPQMQQIAQANRGVNRDPTLCDTDPVINYEQPLMTCMETLINNKQDFTKKLAGMPNTISVPLMTYCNSLEQGTVFAPEEPANLLDLPVVIIENIDLKLTPTENSMQSSTTDSILTTKCHGKSLPGNVDVSQQYGTVNKHTKNRAGTPINTMGHPYNTGTLHQFKSTKAKALHSMRTPDISLSAFTGSMKECKATSTKKPYVVSIGLNTIIRSRKSRAELASPTVPTRNHSDCALGPNSVQSTTDSNTNFSGTPGPNTLYMEHKRTTTDSVTMNREHFAKPNIPKNVSSCPGYGYKKTANLIKFIQHSESTVSTKSPDAQISGGNIDNSMPLLNCMGTVLQGNVIYNAKPEDLDNDFIEVPLLTCMKIIQSID